MDVVDLAERCCFVLHSFVFFFIFLPGRLWMCKWQGVGPCSAVYPSPFHTHTRAAELLYIVDYVMDFFFGFCFPRSTFLFFKFFARLNFFYNSPIDRYHTHALCTLWPPGQWTHPAGLVNIIIFFFFREMKHFPFSRPHLHYWAGHAHIFNQKRKKREGAYNIGKCLIHCPCCVIVELSLVAGVSPT